MNILNKVNKVFGGLCVVSALALTGCAQNQTVAGSESNTGFKEDKKLDKTSKTGAVGASSASADKSLDYATMNPVSIMFDKLSVKLSDGDKQIFPKIKDRAQKAKKITITGYCDRKQVGNAKAAATARALAVKNELLHLGVKPATIRIKHVTDVMNKHAVEVEMAGSI